MERFRVTLFTGILLLLYSCQNLDDVGSNHKEPPRKVEVPSHIINLSTLSEYFGTNEVDLDTVKGVINVNVRNSKLLLAKKEKMGNKWQNPEAWVSVVATHQSKLLDSNIDSLTYTVKMDKAAYYYSYSVKQLQRAREYLTVCEKFADYLNSTDYDSIRNLLSDSIEEKRSDGALKNLLSAIFDENTITHTELIATKIIGNKYSFYINFWYAPDRAQAYGFSFIEPDSRIAGIRILK
jgi:hypothetical protein